MGKKADERNRIIAIIERRIAELKTGKQVHHWDVPHKPTEPERDGRVKMLKSVIAEILGHKEAEGTGE
jgi:hypothetical protein